MNEKGNTGMCDFRARIETVLLCNFRFLQSYKMIANFQRKCVSESYIDKTMSRAIEFDMMTESVIDFRWNCGKVQPLSIRCYSEFK